MTVTSRGRRHQAKYAMIPVGIIRIVQGPFFGKKLGVRNLTRSTVRNILKAESRDLSRDEANEDVCLAVACGCWVAESCQRRLALGFRNRTRKRGRKGQYTASANAGEQDTSQVWRETANEDLCLAVACGCWLAEYCQRRLAIGF
jgi:hypothetical protein